MKFGDVGLQSTLSPEYLFAFVLVRSEVLLYVRLNTLQQIAFSTGDVNGVHNVYIYAICFKNRGLQICTKPGVSMEKAENIEDDSLDITPCSLVEVDTFQR
jgi:hypothetical protein